MRLNLDAKGAFSRAHCVTHSRNRYDVSSTCERSQFVSRYALAWCRWNLGRYQSRTEKLDQANRIEIPSAIDIWRAWRHRISSWHQVTWDWWSWTNLVSQSFVYFAKAGHEGIGLYLHYADYRFLEGTSKISPCIIFTYNISIIPSFLRVMSTVFVLFWSPKTTLLWT